MNITKIGSLTEQEKGQLVQTGTILGALAKALSAQEIDEIDKESLELVEAIKDVATRIAE